MKPGNSLHQLEHRIQMSLFKEDAIINLLCFTTRQKAEEDRLRKEDEKTRRELIKQEYLRRKQQEVLEEQGLVKPKIPKTPKPKQKHQHRPKSVFREESLQDNLSKCPSTCKNVI